MHNSLLINKQAELWHGPLSHWCREGKTLAARPLKKHFFYVCLPLRSGKTPVNRSVISIHLRLSPVITGYHRLSPVITAYHRLLPVITAHCIFRGNAKAVPLSQVKPPTVGGSTYTYDTITFVSHKNVNFIFSVGNSTYSRWFHLRHRYVFSISSYQYQTNEV